MTARRWLASPTWALVALVVSPGLVVSCARSDATDREPLVAGLAQLETLQATVEVSVDEAVAVCMRRAGFDYVPTTPAPSPHAGADGLDGHEFRERYGYGITTIVAVDAAGPADDPNTAILAALDASANDAYLDAMFGPVDADPPKGCFNDARREVIGPFDRFMADHATELGEIWQHVRGDPDVVEAQAAWSQCMAREGIDAVDSQDVRDDISARLATLDPGDRGALAALQAEERAVALIDERCASQELDAVTERILAGQRQRLEGAGSSLFRDLETLTSGSSAGPG